MNKISKRLLLAISLVLFIVSLTQECYTVNGSPSVGSFGLIAFMLGWMNYSLSGLCWLANPFFILACIFRKKDKPALIFAVLAVILAASFLLVNDVVINEAGQTGKVDGHLPGYWFWLASHFLLLITIALRYRFMYTDNLNN
jgi:hypothetical protein